MSNAEKVVKVAVKLESVKARHPQLLYESKLYKILQVTRLTEQISNVTKIYIKTNE